MSRPSKCPVCGSEPESEVRDFSTEGEYVRYCPIALIKEPNHIIVMFGATQEEADSRWEKIAGRKAAQAGEGEDD